MPDITVYRHGDRWAVLEAGTESPTKEFETREAAELEARHLADGGEVSVDEDDPTGLGPETVAEVEVHEPRPKPDGADELARSIDAGL